MFRKIRLRTKFLLSLLAVTAGLTAATLSVVSYRVEESVRQSLQEELQSSVKTYQTSAEQRENTMVRSAALIANLPNVRALMTTDDIATIQDESEEIRRLSGSDLLVLANRRGEVVGLQTKAKDLDRGQAAILLRAGVQQERSKDWWVGSGHLYEVWLQPIYFGAEGRGSVIGVLAVGHEIDDQLARDFGHILSSEIVFQSRGKTLASSLTQPGGSRLPKAPETNGKQSAQASRELQLENERYLASTVSLSPSGEPEVTLTVLKSLDKATAFLTGLNHILLGLGVLSVISGGTLVFLISHTFTKPLSQLVAGVHALQQGRFDYPLETGAGDEVAEVTGAFDRMRTNLQKTQQEQRQLEERLRQACKMEAVGRLAGGVAHDFNNLLTVIRGNSDILLDKSGTDPSQRKYLEQIQKASDRAVSMTRQLLAFSRMQVLQPRLVQLNTSISEMGKMIPRLIGEHIEFTFLPEANLAPVLADPGQIEQVILNLAVNARDAMPDGGKLTVTTRNITLGPEEAAKRPPMKPGEFVLVSVSDTGHGMDADTKARIFEPFFTTKEIGKGTGLGLATVYGVVKQSGGFIWVESEKGKGATFEVYLPACQQTFSERDGRRQAVSIPGGRETILLVEDETGVRELASEFLNAGGYTVLEARDGAQALECADRYAGAIHVLLTDIVMPHVGGADLAERLRAKIPDLRVVYMTGYAEFSGDGDNRPGRERVLQKPFSRVTLLEKVREVLGTVHQVSSES